MGVSCHREVNWSTFNLRHFTRIVINMKVALALVLSLLISHTQAVCDLFEARKCFGRNYIAYVKSNAKGRGEACKNWNSFVRSDCFENCPWLNMKDAIGEKVSKNSLITFCVSKVIFIFFRGSLLWSSFAPRLLLIAVTNLYYRKQ